jgi:hypothetical protein
MKERKKERKKEDLTYFGGKTWLASLLNMPYFWHFTLPDWKTIPVNLVLTICLAKVITKSESTLCWVKTIVQVCYLLDYLLQHKKKERKKERKNILNIL